MCHRRLIALTAAAVAAAALPGVASAAGQRDVRTDVRNALDRPVDVEILRDGTFELLRTLGPDEKIRDVTTDDSELTLRVPGCGRLRFVNPIVTRPHVIFDIRGNTAGMVPFSEGSTAVDMGNPPALRWTVRRLEDSEDHKEFLTVLRACEPPATPPSANAAALTLDVRADFTNGLDRTVQLQVWRDGDWQPRAGVDPDETVRDITTRTSGLGLRVVGCGRLKLDNPLVGRPLAFVGRGTQFTQPSAFAEGDAKNVGFASVRFGVRRLDDSDDFKEFAATLRTCDPETTPETR